MCPHLALLTVVAMCWKNRASICDRGIRDGKSVVLGHPWNSIARINFTSTSASSVVGRMGESGRNPTRKWILLVDSTIAMRKSLGSGNLILSLFTGKRRKRKLGKIDSSSSLNFEFLNTYLRNQLIKVISGAFINFFAGWIVIRSSKFQIWIKLLIKYLSIQLQINAPQSVNSTTSLLGRYIM